MGRCTDPAARGPAHQTEPPHHRAAATATASIFKLHEGEDRLLDAIAYQAPLLDMVEQGYVVPVRAKLPHAAIDVSGFGKRGGECIPGQLEAAADKAPLRELIADEMLPRAPIGATG